MAQAFAPFTAELSWSQVSLLLDTVSYFEDAPKWLTLPAQGGERVEVPLLPDTLRGMLATLPEEEPAVRKPFSFTFEWTDEQAATGVVTVTLPTGGTLRQPTLLTAFSAL